MPHSFIVGTVGGAGVVIVTVAVAVLFPGLESVNPPVTVAVLTAVPRLEGLTLTIIVIVLVSPLVMSPSSQVTVLPLRLHVPLPEVTNAETSVRPEVKGSVTVT